MGEERDIGRRSEWHHPTTFQMFCRITLLFIYSCVWSKLYIVMNAVDSYLSFTYYLADPDWLDQFSEATSCVLKVYCLVNITCIMMCFRFSDMWYYQMCSKNEKRCGKM